MNEPARNIEQSEVRKPRVPQTPANTRRTSGHAVFKISRKFRRCEFCQQAINPGDLYVLQDRWLMTRGYWIQPGPRHDLCFGKENQHPGMSGVRA